VGDKMKPYDNTIKYFELLMSYEDTSKTIRYDLPDGFHWEFYKKGDELEWVDIHLSSREFTSVEKGLKYFHKFYDSFIQELDKRCIFIVEDSTGKKVGTVTISLLAEPEFGYKGACDWLAIRRDYQGYNLSKPLISRMVELANELGHEKIILHTQTTTWLAAKLYLDYGFEILNKENVDGWNILKTLTNHSKLEEFKTVSNDEIFDKRNIEIERQLIEMYGTADFNYEVWYKNGVHNVYTYFDGEPYEYVYYIDENGLRLKEVKEKQYKR